MAGLTHLWRRLCGRRARRIPVPTVPAPRAVVPTYADALVHAYNTITAGQLAARRSKE